MRSGVCNLFQTIVKTIEYQATLSTQIYYTLWNPHGIDETSCIFRFVKQQLN